VGTFNAGNVFTVQLSNGSGSFANAVDIGSINSSIAGTINAVIPINTIFGNAYKIRLKSSNPVSTGADNGANIIINPKSNAGAITGDDDVCVGHIINYVSTGENGGVWESTNQTVLSINPQTGAGVALAEGTTTIKYTVGIACPDIATRPIVVTGIPQINSQPVSVIRCTGESATLSVVATGNNLTYQWRRGGQNLQGQNGSSIFLGNLTIPAAGDYDVGIENGCNSVTS